MNYLIKNKTIDEAKSDIDKVILNESIPEFVSTAWNDNDLIITIQKMGLSQLVLRLGQDQGDVLINENNRKVAIFHRPYITLVEDIMKRLLDKAGAIPY
jgi:hypothetical protein